MIQDNFISELIKYGFSESFAEKVYNALLTEHEDMIESYLYTAKMLYDEEEE